MRAIRLFFLITALVVHSFCIALSVGVAKTDITLPIGSPSAGYTERSGEGMTGIHDPLFAIALFIDNEEESLALCSVDHLGFSYEMVQKITKIVQAEENLMFCKVIVGSSHTHSGGGAYLNIPVIGKSLAGTYSPELTQYYIEKTAEAIISASQNKKACKIGIGYGKAENISKYRGLYAEDITPLSDVCIIKVVDENEKPLAVLFNYPLHPTVLDRHNLKFSSDFVGYAREHIQSNLSGIEAIYFNGAQGDIIPLIQEDERNFDTCEKIGKSLADTVTEIWNNTEVSGDFEIACQKFSYSFTPQATPFGLTLPIKTYPTEMNILVFNQTHAFLTIPGELSCLYDRRLKVIAQELGYEHLSILGLVNDAHGYIILPESWRHKTMESGLSFGGESYGAEVEQKAVFLMHALKNNGPHD